MENKYIVNMTGIEKSFSGVPVLKKVDLRLRRGEILALMGENGAGKSTLVNVLMGVHNRDGGTIEIDGKAMDDYSIQIARQNGITMIPQELALVPAITVAENIMLGNRCTSKAGAVDWKTMYRKAKEVIDDLGFDIDPRVRLDSLPISYRQIVSIIKVVAENARVIIMDEPTSSLSREEVVRLQKIIFRLQERGVAIIYISHLMDEIFEIADTITILRDGMFIGSKKKDETNQREVISLMVGEGLLQTQETLRKEIETGNTDVTSKETVLEVKGMKRKADGPEISFELKKGEVLGITGLVGAGKTELLRNLIGIDKYADGEIYVKGEKAEIKSPKDAYRYRISAVPEDRKLQGLVLMRSVKDNIALAEPYRKGISKLGIVNSKKEKEDAQKSVEQLSIKIAGLSQRAGRLSGGNQQKCVISKALLVEPEILMLDEPTRGIDVGAKTTIYKLIRKLRDDGVGVILFSSDVAEIPIVCDRVLVLSNGKIVGELTGREATVNHILDYTAGGVENGNAQEK